MARKFSARTSAQSHPKAQHSRKRLRGEAKKLWSLILRCEAPSLPASHAYTHTLLTPSLLTFMCFLSSPSANPLHPVILTITEILTSGNLLRAPSSLLPAYIHLCDPHLLGDGVRHSTRGKGHEEGGSTYAKAGSSLRSPPGNPRASTP